MREDSKAPLPTCKESSVEVCGWLIVIEKSFRFVTLPYC